MSASGGHYRHPGREQIKGPKQEALKKEICLAFQQFDRDGDGVVTLAEAHEILQTKLGFSVDKTRRLLRMCDRNGDGTLSFPEFVDFYIRVKEKIQEMEAMFYEFDQDGNGMISMDEAKRAFRHMCFNEDEIENLVRVYDTNDDGYLQYDEFVKMWNAS